MSDKSQFIEAVEQQSKTETPGAPIVYIPRPKGEHRMTYDQLMEALCLWREARGASLPAKAAVLAVIRNRVADKRWPNTSAGVITQPFQFSSFNASDPNVTKWPTPGPEWQAWQDCLAVVETPLTADPTNGATNYESLPDGMAKPKWADDAHFTCKIGPFSFYRL